MSIGERIKIWLMDFLCISNYDRKVERKFGKMRRLYEKGGLINRLRARRMENKLQEKYQLNISLTAEIGKTFRFAIPCVSE